ncbi:UNVERIFIED_CONTAM: hypothetical protein K2H54_008068, partial [Gekko kuhli]
MPEEGGEIGNCPGGSSLCSYYGWADGPLVSKRQLQPEARAAATAGESLGGTSLGKRELPLPPTAADEPVPSPPIVAAVTTTNGEGDPQEKRKKAPAARVAAVTMKTGTMRVAWAVPRLATSSTWGSCLRSRAF